VSQDLWQGRKHLWKNKFASGIRIKAAKRRERNSGIKPKFMAILWSFADKTKNGIKRKSSNNFDKSRKRFYCLKHTQKPPQLSANIPPFSERERLGEEPKNLISGENLDKKNEVEWQFVSQQREFLCFCSINVILGDKLLNEQSRLFLLDD
jgi:hypothetical protein